MEWTFSNAWTSDMCSEIHTLIDFLYLMPLNSMRYFFISDKFQEVNMNGRLNKVAMTAKLMQLKNAGYLPIFEFLFFLTVGITCGSLGLI